MDMFNIIKVIENVTQQRHNTGGLTPQVKTAVHLYLKNHSFENNNVKILAREDRWFERGERIYLCQTGMTVIEQRKWPVTLLTTCLQCGIEFLPQTA